MTISHVLILGAGPAGLSTAIALAKTSTSSSPLKITVLELRDQPATIGGAVNLTPLGLRYLDYLGVGTRLRTQAHKVEGIQLVSLRTGTALGTLWEGLDAVRATRESIVGALLDTIREEHAGVVSLVWGFKTVAVSEGGGDDTSPNSHGTVSVISTEGQEITGDVLLGCDGLHSAARRLYVDPDRKNEYTGRVVTMGYAPAAGAAGSSQDGGRRAQLAMADGSPALRSTTLLYGQRGSLLVSFFTPSRDRVFLASVMAMKEPEGDARDGWTLMGRDGAFLEGEIARIYPETRGGMKGVQALLADCEEWNLYPVYALPPRGRWSRGRVLLLGDAAHAMPPQGESTGIAIEDGVLLAHVFSRRGARGADRLFADYEGLRRGVINGHYAGATWRWRTGNADNSWWWAVLMEWFTMGYLMLQRGRQEDHFSGDVRKLELPE